MKLAIGLPAVSDMVHTTFLDSWTLMVKPEFIYCRPSFPAGPTSDICAIRNNLVQQALEDDVTRLLQLDTDQAYPSDLISKLLGHKLPIVAAKVHRRYPPFDPILCRGTVDNFTMVLEEEWKKEKLVKVDATGGGCILIDTNVFLDIEYPWYEYGKNKDGKIVGEDINFCLKAAKAGYEIFVDTSIQIDHMGMLAVNQGVYDVFKILNSAEQKRVKENLGELK